MSNIVEPQITETKSTKWMNDLLITSNTGVVGGIDYDLSKSEKGLIKKPTNPIEGGQAFLDRQNQLAQQQAVLQAKSFEKLTAEDRLYEKLGIKYHNTHMFGVASRMKGRFYLGLLLIAGYFAYKKFKK